MMTSARKSARQTFPCQRMKCTHDLLQVLEAYLSAGMCVSFVSRTSFLCEFFRAFSSIRLAFLNALFPVP